MSAVDHTEKYGSCAMSGVAGGRSAVWAVSVEAARNSSDAAWRAFILGTKILRGNMSQKDNAIASAWFFQRYLKGVWLQFGVAVMRQRETY